MLFRVSLGKRSAANNNNNRKKRARANTNARERESTRVPKRRDCVREKERLVPISRNDKKTRTDLKHV